MPNLSALSRGTQVLAAAGLLLLIDTFLPWQDFGDAVGGDIAESLGVDATWNAWHGFWGVVMGLMVIALLAWVIARIMDVRLPVEVPDGPVTVPLGGLILLFALIKNLADDYSTIWSYIGVLLAAAVAYGAWLRYQEAGGTIDSLKTAIPRQAPSGSSAGPAGTAPMQSEPDVTPTAPAEPTTPQPPQAAQPTQPMQPAQPAEPAQPAPPAPPAQPAPPERTTGPAPTSPQTTEPMTQAGPTPPGPPTPPREPSDETEAERRPPQPPPQSSTDQS